MKEGGNHGAGCLESMGAWIVRRASGAAAEYGAGSFDADHFLFGQRRMDLDRMRAGVAVPSRLSPNRYDIAGRFALWFADRKCVVEIDGCAGTALLDQ